MIQLCKFYLKLSLGALCALGKNIKNQTRTVDHAALQGSFEIAFLCGRQRMVDDDQIALVCSNFSSDFLDLSLAGVGRCVRALTTPADNSAHVGACRLYQQPDFLQPILSVTFTEIKLDYCCPFATGVTFKHEDLSTQKSQPDWQKPLPIELIHLSEQKIAKTKANRIIPRYFHPAGC